MAGHRQAESGNSFCCRVTLSFIEREPCTRRDHRRPHLRIAFHPRRRGRMPRVLPADLGDAVVAQLQDLRGLVQGVVPFVNGLRPLLDHADNPATGRDREYLLHEVVRVQLATGIAGGKARQIAPVGNHPRGGGFNDLGMGEEIDPVGHGGRAVAVPGNNLLQGPLAPGRLPAGQVAGAPPEHQPPAGAVQVDDDVSGIPDAGIALEWFSRLEAGVIGVESRRRPGRRLCEQLLRAAQARTLLGCSCCCGLAGIERQRQNAGG